MKQLLTTGILTSYRPRSDKSFSLTINILIPNKEQKEVIDDLHQQEVLILLREGNQITEEEAEVIDKVDIELGNGKSLSQRLRNVLYVNYTQDALGYTDFKDYYKHTMEKIILHYKDKLD